MQIAELKEITPLLAAAIAASATLLAVAVTNYFNLKVSKVNIETQRKQKIKELTLEKLEDLFFLFDKWKTHFSNIYLCYLRCHRGKLAFNDVLDQVNELTLLAPGEAQKFKMIMEVYFPYLAKEYQLVETARKRIVPFLSDPQEKKINVQEFESYQVAFEQACDVFKSKISSLAQATLSE